MELTKGTEGSEPKLVLLQRKILWSWLLKLNHVCYINLSESLKIINGRSPANLLLFHGGPMYEKVVQFWSFVMASQQEIVDTVEESQRTKFGRCP